MDGGMSLSSIYWISEQTRIHVPIPKNKVQLGRRLPLQQKFIYPNGKCTNRCATMHASWS
jgi:hypothetical protein